MIPAEAVEGDDSAMSITEFLEARIAEDEYGANRELLWGNTPTLTRMNARIIAECAAKRAIIAQTTLASRDRDTIIVDHYWKQADIDGGYATDPGKLILQALVAVYKDHPDYRQEWAASE